ncbi:hypothetical protein P7C73_g340, partial [Tremellales sp. Uapishka_1]
MSPSDMSSQPPTLPSFDSLLKSIEGQSGACPSMERSNTSLPPLWANSSTPPVALPNRPAGRPRSATAPSIPSYSQSQTHERFGDRVRALKQSREQWHDVMYPAALPAVRLLLDREPPIEEK